jgi:MFS superfamily sulfate permease-like transporter
LFANLPQAALGAIVITVVVFGLFKVREMRRLQQTLSQDGVLVLIPEERFYGSVAAAIEAGLLSTVCMKLPSFQRWKRSGR